MSLLPKDTYVNASRSLWAAAGSGGGGGGSTLQSPASITPAVNGSAVLSVAVTSGAGVDAVVNVSNTTGNDAVIAMSNTAGGNSVIEMGLAGSAVVVFAPSLTNAGKLNVAPVLPNGSPGTPNLSIDTVGATVTAQNLLLVGQAAFGNQLAAAPLTANTSKVTQTLAAGGSMAIGSSVANPAGLLVSDIVTSGFANHVEVAGQPGVASLFLAGAQGGANECYVFPSVATTGIQYVGSSVANTQAITVTDTATTIKNLGGAPQTLLATTTIPAGNITQQTGTFPNPVGEGLYAVVGCAASTNQPSRQQQFSVIAYVNATGQVQMGGSVFSDAGSIGGTDGLLVYPQQGGANFLYAYTGSTPVTNFSVVAFKLSGAIPGTF